MSVGGIGWVGDGVVDGCGVSVSVGVGEAVRVGMMKVIVGVKVGRFVPVCVICGVPGVGENSINVGVEVKLKRSVEVTEGVMRALTLTPLLIQIVTNPSR